MDMIIRTRGLHGNAMRVECASSALLTLVTSHNPSQSQPTDSMAFFGLADTCNSIISDKTTYTSKLIRLLLSKRPRTNQDQPPAAA
jgi:hypothetical protein